MRERVLPWDSDSVSISWHTDSQISLPKKPERCLKVFTQREISELSQGIDERATKTEHLTGLGVIKEQEEENENLPEKMGMGHGVGAQARGYYHHQLSSSNATGNYPCVTRIPTFQKPRGKNRAAMKGL